MCVWSEGGLIYSQTLIAIVRKMKVTEMIYRLEDRSSDRLTLSSPEFECESQLGERGTLVCKERGMKGFDILE